ncbi:hypothetical protein NDU88_003231 [Pleurodeles waltl]|uniref:Uncharacterized protein n=1 Tax=Pleurodeles waltl TaxID=8319 RepID=A0AAV7W5G6_PLEWA|nr:hypothetical protein NDU88_003231 [Pleurodeles waltl]
MSNNATNTFSIEGRVENELLLIPVTTSTTAPVQDLAVFYANTTQTDDTVYYEPSCEVDPPTSNAPVPAFAETASGYFDIADFSSDSSTPVIENVLKTLYQPEIRRTAHWIDAKLSQNDAARLPERNQRSACRAVQISTQHPLDRLSPCDFVLQAPDFNASSLGRPKTPRPEEDP